MQKPIIVERFADNGEHSHWELVNPTDGTTLYELHGNYPASAPSAEEGEVWEDVLNEVLDILSDIERPDKERIAELNKRFTITRKTK